MEKLEVKLEKCGIFEGRVRKYFEEYIFNSLDVIERFNRFINKNLLMFWVRIVLYWNDMIWGFYFRVNLGNIIFFYDF